jgi:nucleotide-binding universal stress UspA family protein
MYARILIPLDGSKMGEAALPVIEDLFNNLSPKTTAEVTLLNVISSLSHWVVVGGTGALVSYSEEEIQEIKHHVMVYLNQAGEGLRSKGAMVNIRVKTGGNAGEKILEVAEEIKPDMIAMSTHGRSGLSRFVFGSITDKVLRGANVPVLAVRASEGTANVS